VPELGRLAFNCSSNAGGQVQARRDDVS